MKVGLGTVTAGALYKGQEHYNKGHDKNLGLVLYQSLSMMLRLWGYSIKMAKFLI